MKRKIKNGLIILFAGFVLLFLLRLIYGYRITAQDANRQGVEGLNNFFDQTESGDFTYDNFNIASSKFKGKWDGGTQAGAVDQKYEKIGLR